MARKKQPQNLWIKISYLFILFLVFVAVNSYLSDLIVDLIRAGKTLSNQYITFVYTQNTGAAFSILHNSPYIVIAISAIALIAIFAYIIRHAGTMSFAGISWLALMLSGIFCNLFERITLGFVRDYFNLRFIDFPIFNISDLAINISVAAIIIMLLTKTQLKNL